MLKNMISLLISLYTLKHASVWSGKTTLANFNQTRLESKGNKI